MAVVTTRRKPASDDLGQLRGELAELKAALQVVARVTANVAAKAGHGPWTDFQKLLTDQYGVAHADAEVFLAILTGRTP